MDLYHQRLTKAYPAAFLWPRASTRPGNETPGRSWTWQGLGWDTRFHARRHIATLFPLPKALRLHTRSAVRFFALSAAVVGIPRLQDRCPGVQAACPRALDYGCIPPDGRPVEYIHNQALEGTQLRSEEHTSELQSLAYLVCRLLLEKKKYK